jgi:hypothetical protein
LAQCLAGFLTTGFRTESLVITAPRIGGKQLFTAQASAASALGHHRARTCLPELSNADKKTDLTKPNPRIRTPKKEEGFKEKSSKKTDQENGSLPSRHVWLRFRTPLTPSKEQIVLNVDA